MRLAYIDDLLLKLRRSLEGAQRAARKRKAVEQRVHEVQPAQVPLDRKRVLINEKHLSDLKAKAAAKKRGTR